MPGYQPETHEMTDILQRFLFSELPVRGVVVSLHDTYKTVLSRHDYPPPVQALLGEMLSAVAMLTSILKFEGSLILQARAEGPLPIAMAECNHKGEMRAIAKTDEGWNAAHDRWTFAELMRGGQLAITIDPEDGNRYQGIVPLDAPSLAACLEHYFAQSEQLPSRLWLAAANGHAGGVMLQVMPEGASADEQLTREASFEHVTTLADTLRPEELTGLDAETLLYRLYHQDPVELLPVSEISFKCSCSRARSEKALLSLGADDLRQLLLEQDGRISVGCEFCHQKYEFDSVDVEGLLDGSADGSPTVH